MWGTKRDLIRASPLLPLVSQVKSGSSSEAGKLVDPFTLVEAGELPMQRVATLVFDILIVNWSPCLRERRPLPALSQLAWPSHLADAGSGSG